MQATAPNRIHAEKDWPPAVVGGVFQNGLNLMRTLISHGVRAVGVDHIAEHEGFRSSYGRSYAAPDPDRNPAEWVAFMQHFSRELTGWAAKKPVFICTADAFVAALGAHGEALRDFYIFSPAARLQAALNTKETQNELADRYAFPRPLTAHIKSRADLQAFAAQAQFPCLLKPLSNREWGYLPEGNPLRGQKVATADSAAELLSHYAHTEPYRPDVVAQEIIEGPDTEKYAYFAAYACDGSLLGSAVARELRCHPIFFGGASVMHPVVDEEIATLCDRFFRAMGYAGDCEIELKRDARDGRLKLIEVNARFTGSSDVAACMGVETGWLHYLDLIGRKPEPVQASRFDFHHICLKLDCMALPGYLSRGVITWREAIVPYRGKVEFYDLDMRDWKLASGTILRCARYLAGGALRHFRGRTYRGQK
jgi:predicted ATP-grasp superfamily ATP-dependent carboligase